MQTFGVQNLKIKCVGASLYIISAVTHHPVRNDGQLLNILLHILYYCCNILSKKKKKTWYWFDGFTWLF